jgi:protein-tyrosine-phosphatase
VTKSETALLFVSERDTCRSLMATGLARQMLGESVRLKSAGIDVGFFTTPSEAIEVMRGHGVYLGSHDPTHIRKVPLQEFTSVVAMAPSIGQVLANRYHIGDDRLELWDIEDPYGKGIVAYRTCAKEILSNLQLLLVKLGLPEPSPSQ